MVDFSDSTNKFQSHHFIGQITRNSKIFGSLQIIIWTSFCHLRQELSYQDQVSYFVESNPKWVSTQSKTSKTVPSLLNLIIFHRLLLFNSPLTWRPENCFVLTRKVSFWSERLQLAFTQPFKDESFLYPQVSCCCVW